VDAPQSLDSDNEGEDPDYIPVEEEDDALTETHAEDLAQDFVVELIEEGFITLGVGGTGEEGFIEEDNNDETNSTSRYEDDEESMAEQSTDEVGEPVTKNIYQEN
jgi:hypothetical protein